tara:strand:+ start:70 stop:675 length:606 start_codon:yes stop_codon:yes gene_type:complete
MSHSKTSSASSIKSSSSRILDSSLTKSRTHPVVNLSAFAFLFAELVKHSQHHCKKITDLERKLEQAGHSVGYRVLELVAFRERRGRRDKKIIPMLQFVTTNCWKTLFGKEADSLQASAEEDGQYMIFEAEPVTNKFVSVPSSLGGARSLNCASYIAGIIGGILTGAGFTTESVQALFAEDGRTVFVIKFDADVIARDKLVL